MRRKDILITVAASVIFAGVASGTTWYFGVKKVAAEFDERLDKEVTASVSFILGEMGTNILMTDDDPEELADELEAKYDTVSVEAVEEAEVTPLEPLDEIVGERVFPNAGMTMDDMKAQAHKVRYDKILTKEQYIDPEPVEEIVEVSSGWNPDDDTIAVIGRDIFMENISEYEQSTITYFQDNGVIDEDSDLVVDHERLIGFGKPPFGQMSEDENIVYIRNHSIKAEYEVIQDPGKATDFLMHGLQDIYNPPKRT